MPTLHPTPLRRRWLDALLACLLGGLTVLLLLELGLRALGTVTANRPDEAQQAEFTVLAEGDSFTYGLGAPAGRGWPEQLQELLSNAGFDAQVVNRGRLTASTATTNEDLVQDLDTYHPDAVVFLIGDANFSDYRGLADWQAQHAVASRMPEVLWHLRTYRLLRFLTTDWRRHGLGAGPTQGPEIIIPGAQAPLEPARCGIGAAGPADRGQTFLMQEDYEAALMAFRQALSHDPNCMEALQGTLGAHLANGKVEEALAFHRDVLLAHPANQELHSFGLSDFIGRGLASQAIAFMEQWLTTADGVTPVHYLALAVLLESEGHYGRALEAYEQAKKDPPLTCPATWGMARASFRNGDEAAGREFLTRIGRNPMGGCHDFVGLLASLCSQGLQRESLAWLELAVTSHHQEWFPYVRSVQACLTADDLPWLRNLLLTQVPERDMVEKVMAELERGDNIRTMVEPWLRDGLQELLARTRQRGIPTLLATYPNANRTNGLIREMAAATAVPLLDHEQHFQRLWQAGERREDYFANDGNNPIERNDHCSERGYGVMAQKTYEGLRDAGLLPQE